MAGCGVQPTTTLFRLAAIVDVDSSAIIAAVAVRGEGARAAAVAVPAAVPPHLRLIQVTYNSKRYEISTAIQEPQYGYG